MTIGHVQCLGCGMPVDYNTAERVWLSTAIGITCLRTHPGCEDRAAANHAEQPAKRIPEPMSAVERKKRATAAKATGELQSGARPPGGDSSRRR